MSIGPIPPPDELTDPQDRACAEVVFQIVKTKPDERAIALVAEVIAGHVRSKTAKIRFERDRYVHRMRQLETRIDFALEVFAGRQDEKIP